MNLSERAIQYPRLIILGAVLICVAGAIALMKLPKERTPRVRLPVIMVAVPNLGAAPPLNEREILNPIEKEIDTLEGLKDKGAVQSRADDGAAVLMFTFDQSVDVTEAKRDVESLINRVKGEFPADAQQDPGPLVTDIAFEDYPIIQIFIAGGSDGLHRRRIAERLKTRIEKLEGISGVDLFGGLEPEVQIEIDPHRMTLYGFGYEQVDAAIRRANHTVPAGTIEAGNGGDSRVRIRGRLETLDEIGRIPLGVRNGKPIVLSDVASVRMGHEPRKNIARYGGQDAVVLLVKPRTDIDVLGTANKVQSAVATFIGNGEAEDTQIGTVRSQAREIAFMIEQLGTSAIYGTILVVVVLWIFMGWRNSVLISVALPFALFGAAAIMWIAKYCFNPDLAINKMTLFAAILVVGMVVGGCIIVAENIYRHRELGRSAVEAARRGIAEVGGSLFGSYATTFVAFAGLFLVGGIMGDFIEVLPLVVLFALLAAILMDHFLVPVLSVYVMKLNRHRSRNNPRNDPQIADTPGGNQTAKQIEIANAESAVAGRRVLGIYGRMLQFAMHNRLLVLSLVVAMAITPVLAFGVGAIGLELFPDNDYPQIELYFELPLGSSMEKRTTKVAQQIEAAVMRAVYPHEWYRPSPKADRVKPVTTMGEPDKLLTRLDVDHGSGPEFGMVYIELELPQNRQRSVADIRQAILEALPPLPGVMVRIKSPKEGPPVGVPVLVRVRGRSDTSMDTLAQRAANVEHLLRGIPGIYDVTNDFRVRQQMTARPNPIVATLYDIDTAQIGRSVNYALVGVDVGQVDFGGDEQIGLRMRNLPQYRDEMSDLKELPLRSPTGKIVSLEQVADLERVQAPNVIHHYDQKRVIHVRTQLDDGVSPDDVKRALIAAMRPDLTDTKQHTLARDRRHKVIKLDDQVIIEFGGENEIRDEALDDLILAVIVAVLAMFVILTIKFNSFMDAAIVLFSVPLSLIGVSIGLILCGLKFSIAALIGVAALSGIVVNDAIVLVDFIHRMRCAGVPMREAVIYAGQLRLRPIFLTTVTTIGGLLPLALNLSGSGEFWQPLTVTIIFGLGFATLLQLFVIPLAMYTFRRLSVSFYGGVPVVRFLVDPPVLKGAA